MEIKVNQVYKGNRAMQSTGKLRIVEIKGNVVKVENHNAEGFVNISKLQESIDMGLLVLIS